jgi:hypothetical protein
MDLINAWVTYKRRSIYGIKSNDTSFELTNMQTYLITICIWQLNFLNLYMNMGNCLSNICMTKSKFKGRKLNQMVYWIFFLNVFLLFVK